MEEEEKRRPEFVSQIYEWLDSQFGLCPSQVVIPEDRSQSNLMNDFVSSHPEGRRKKERLNEEKDGMQGHHP